MDNIFKYFREEETGKERMKPFSGEELSKEFKKLGYDISSQSIRRLENGITKSPSDIQLKAYSAYFNMTTDHLLGLSNNTATDEENIVAISNYTGLSLKAIDHLKDSSEEEKAVLNAFIETSLNTVTRMTDSYFYRMGAKLVYNGEEMDDESKREFEEMHEARLLKNVFRSITHNKDVYNLFMQKKREYEIAKVDQAGHRKEIADIAEEAINDVFDTLQKHNKRKRTDKK